MFDILSLELQSFHQFVKIGVLKSMNQLCLWKVIWKPYFVENIYGQNIFMPLLSEIIYHVRKF